MQMMTLDRMKKKLTRFSTVFKHVTKEHDTNNPDVVVPMKSLRVTNDGNISVPKLGEYKMTDWSKSQLGTLLGVNWDKWFNPKLINMNTVQREVKSRLDHTSMSCKIRTRKDDDKTRDGHLRAFLSPTYQPIDDYHIFERLELTFKDRIQGLSIVNRAMSGFTGQDDRMSHYTIVGDPINMGEIIINDASKEAAKWYRIANAEGELPEADWLYPGMRLRNSEVGYAAVIIDEYSFRLVCLNGLMISTGGGRLMHRTHKKIASKELDRHLSLVFDKAPDRWEDTVTRLKTLQTAVVDEPNTLLEETLDALGSTKKFKSEALVAYSLEPLGTLYGVLQAVTRAARNYADLNKRAEIEMMAGRFLAKVA